mgnify:CR=1 FL=1
MASDLQALVHLCPHISIPHYLQETFGKDADLEVMMFCIEHNNRSTNRKGRQLAAFFVTASRSI